MEMYLSHNSGEKVNTRQKGLEVIDYIVSSHENAAEIVSTLAHMAFENRGLYVSVLTYLDSEKRIDIFCKKHTYFNQEIMGMRKFNRMDLESWNN